MLKSPGLALRAAHREALCRNVNQRMVLKAAATTGLVVSQNFAVAML
jgi:hypothetical protein